MFKFNVKVHYYPRKSRIDKQGRVHLWYYVNAGGIKSKERSSGIKVYLDDWLKGNVPRSVRRQQEQLELGIDEAWKALRESGNPYPTADEIVQHYYLLMSLPPLLLDVAKDHTAAVKLMGRRRKRRKGESARSVQAKSTAAAHKSRLSVLTSYLQRIGKTALPVTAVSNAFATDYEKYLRTAHVITTGKRKGEIGLISTSVKKQIDFLSQVLDHAVRKDLIKYNPLLAYRVDTSDVARNLDHLTEQELETLATFRFISNPLQRVTDAFVFMCDTGLSYADSDTLTADNLIGVERLPEGLRERLGELGLTEWLTGQRQKTGTSYAVPLTQRARRILEKYGDIDKLPRFANAVFNRYIKEAFQIAGIERLVPTTLLARKTFLHHWRNYPGIQKKTASKMAGHTTEAMMDYYADTTMQGIAADLAKSA